MADILNNPKARRDYHILETFEAGIVLHGTEVKSLRAGKGQIADAFARVEKDEVFLYNAHIDEYAQGNRQNHVPKAARKLLLHKSEIRKLFGLSSVKGNALFPSHFTGRTAASKSPSPWARARSRSTSVKTSRNAIPTAKSNAPPCTAPRANDRPHTKNKKRSPCRLRLSKIP